MICHVITREGYKNIMRETKYGQDKDTCIKCPSDIVAKLKQVEQEECFNCVECWEGVLNKVAFKGDLDY